jgi:hypothetical protein
VEIDGLWQPTENRERDIVIMESLITSGRFTNKDLKEIKYCRMYLQLFYLSDITNIKGNKIAAWAGRGQKQSGCQSTWEWPVQQRPIAWKAWKAALEYLAPDGDIGDPLGQWKYDHHQIMEWYLYAQSNALYHHIEGVWTRHDAMNIGRLRFWPEPHSCDEPTLCAYVVEVNERTRYMEILCKYKIKESLKIETYHVITYTSGIGDSCQALPRHIQRLVGNIPDLELLNGSEENEEQDLIVATDGSVVFGIGYNIWVVATYNEKVLLKGGGPDDGDQILMTSYRSELGSIASGLAVLGTLVRSGKIKVKSVKLVCDNEASVKVCTRKRTQSVFHRTEGDHDLVTTIQYLQDTWCQDVDLKYEWVKGHADDLDIEPTKCERLNIVADEICDVVRASAQGPYGAKPNCELWPNERCSLFIKGIKITSTWKERLTQQLLDGDLQEYLMEKEQWTTHSFQNIFWKRHETALTRISKARQAQTANMCHNLRYNGARHAQWYGKAKPCCMCGDNEDWRHMLT